MNSLNECALTAIDALATLISLQMDISDNEEMNKACIKLYAGAINAAASTLYQDRKVSIEKLKNYKVVFHDAEDVAD